MPAPARFWREMPSSAFSDCDDWIAVLPIAAIEQHGPHMPVGVDAIVAGEMVRRCAAALPDDLPVTFLPVEEVCKSNEHIKYPGTLTLDWDVCIRTWIQIGQSVARAGVKTLVIVTSHGGNVPPMEIVARELHQRDGMRVVTTAWSRLGRESKNGPGPVIDIHAGFYETSLMLAIRPDLVNMNAAQNFASAQSDVVAQTEHLGFHMRDANMAWVSGDLNPAGAVGDALAASADIGEADLQAATKGFVTLMREIAAL